MKINKFIKKYSDPCMWVSGILILVAISFHHIWNVQIVSMVGFIVAFVLAGFPVVVRAISALKYKTVSIELLVSIAAIGACCILEFSEAAIVTFLFQFGSYLEQKTMKKTRNAIRTLTEMAPSKAFRVENLEDGDSKIEEIDADEVEIQDILLVKAGNQIASDGVVVKGEGYAMEASITGESLPKHKEIGDKVYSGTFLDNGTIYMEATDVGEDTIFSKIIALVEEAQDAKSPVERFIDKFAKYYTPFVIVVAILVLIFTRNIDTAITVLVLACPGALVIGAPIANVAGIGRGAREGILLKGGDSIHSFSKTDTVVFDKTGTLTVGSPHVVERIDYNLNEEENLRVVASIERMTEHPLAFAVTEYAKELGLFDIEKVTPIKGLGVEATNASHSYLVGNLHLMEERNVKIPSKTREDVEMFQKRGITTVLAAEDNSIIMLLGIADAVKEDAKKSIQALKKLGIAQSVMLTGDNTITARAVSEELGITDYRGELLPWQKLSVIKELKEKGHVVTFVGDGINDSPAIVGADTGIAMGSGTDVAIESSDVVLIKSDLASLVEAFRLAKKTVRVLYENIVIAVGTVILLLIGLFAGYIHMSIGMLIHEASILVVIFNAMRLLIPKKEK